MSRAMGSHHSARPGSEVWLTPPAVLAALGPFDLDPCAAPEPRPWATAAAHYVEAQDGLSLPWFGRVWVNPPYRNQVIGRWLARLADHGRGTALIFARTETEVFFAQVWRRATALLFLEGRLYFHRPDGTRAAANAGAPSVLCAYGRGDAEVLGDCGLAGQFVPILLPRLVAAAVLSVTWSEAVAGVLGRRDGPVRLDDLYRALQDHPKARGRPHWREKVRQTLKRGGFRRVGRGQWAAPEARAA